jgi:predicted metallo-beta-lactamase superfamily hydrolase
VDIVPVAEESLGVRSMCLYIETRDARILLDAGISLAPLRFGLRPHPREVQRAKELRDDMLRLAEGADIVTVSHYHRDHFTPWYPSAYMATDPETYRLVYGGKRVLAKSPDGLSWSQRVRLYGLLRALKGAAEVAYANGNSWTLGGTRVTASQPFWHGPPGSRTGRVIGFFIKDGEEGLAFLPDVEGPLEPAPVAFVREHRPTIIVVGGPPTYLGCDVSRALSMLAEIVRLRPHTLVLAHHLLRDSAWRERVAPIIDLAERLGVRVTTYAGLAGRREEPLEAMRRELYAREPGPSGSAMSP